MQEHFGEERISTEQHSTEENPWVYGAHVDQGRSSRLKAEKGQRPEETGRGGKGVLIRVPRRNPEPGMRGLYAFPKEEKIRLRADFLRIIREGTRFHTPHFWVAFCPNGLTYRRLGITVGKRVGSAVIRNRLKRRIREFFRQNKGCFPEATDWVVTAKEGAGRLDFWKVADELQGILKER